MQEYITTALEALEKYRAIKATIAEASPAFEAIGYSASLSGSTKGHGSIPYQGSSEETLSRSMWYEFFGQMPWTSSAWRKKMQDEYCGGHQDKPLFWESIEEARKFASHEEMMTRMQDIKKLLLTDLLAKSKNQFAYTRKIKTSCAPEWKKSWSGSSHATPSFSQSGKDLLDNLEIVCRFFDDKDPPLTLPAEIVWDSVSSDSRTHSNLVKTQFQFHYFHLLIYKNGNAVITLSTKAHRILTASNKQKETISASGREQETAATDDMTSPCESTDEPQSPATSGDHASAFMQELKATGTKRRYKNRRKYQQQPQSEASPKEITVHYSWEKGVMVFGDTKPVKDIIKQHGLRWSPESPNNKPHWQIQGSRQRTLGSWEKVRIEQMIKALKDAGWKIKLNLQAAA